MKGQDPIDIMKIYAQWDVTKWNNWLWSNYKKKNVQALTETKKNLQLGMDQLVKKKMNTEKISVTFLRWIKSIDNTIKAIWRDENENPLYNPANAHLKDQFIADKRKKDHELEQFLKSKIW